MAVKECWPVRIRPTIVMACMLMACRQAHVKRYLIAEELDVGRASARLRATVLWRKQWNVMQ